MLRRAASLVNGRPLTLVKVSNRRRHLLFDVPVAGLDTIAVMRETGTTALAVDAGRTLLLDREEMLARADEAGIAWWGRQRRCIESRWSAPGQFGQNHCRVVRESTRAELTAVVDIDPPRAAHARRLPRTGRQGGCRDRSHAHFGPRGDRLLAAGARHRRAGGEAHRAGSGIRRPAGRGRRAPRAHSAGGPPGALQSRGDRAGRPRHAAAVLRDPPAERVQPAQPGRGRDAGPDDPRHRYRAEPDAAPNRRKSAARAFPSCPPRWISPTCACSSRTAAWPT